jgi:hypothetical protein
MLEKFDIIWREEYGMSVVIEAESILDAMHIWEDRKYDQSLVDIDYVEYINDSMEVV